MLYYEVDLFNFQEDYPSIGNWTVSELKNYFSLEKVEDIFANILGALLIYKYSSHRFLLISVIASYTLHLLTPAALNHHSKILFLFVMIGQEIISVPIMTAALSILKDWAPPAERTRLVTISLCGLGMKAFTSLCFIFASHDFLPSLTYYVGISGLLWALFWYNATSDIPQDDPLISENEFLYMESSIPSHFLEKIKLKHVPWKSILKSKQVLILCSIFFKLTISIETMHDAGIFFIIDMMGEHDILYFAVPFITVFAIIFIGSSFLMDFLLQKYRSKTLAIRKYFLCSGFSLHSVFMVGTVISPQIHVKVIFYILAYSLFALSIPGTLTYPLDLSPRYVSLIAGTGFAFFSFGYLCYYNIVTLSFEYMTVISLNWLFISDAISSLCIAIIFGVWGDVEEQPWSLIMPSHRKGNDYKSYPQPDDEDDIVLAT